MTTPLFIGLGGYLTAGKDEVADHLVREHGFVKMGMSDPLHESLMALNPVVPVTGEDHKRLFTERPDSDMAFVTYRALTKELGYTEAKKIEGYRALLQRFGTEVVRDILDPDMWVKIALRRVLEHRAFGQPVVLTGIRFANEFDMVDDYGISVWVDRPGLAPAEHSSENSVRPKWFSHTVLNDGTLEDLYSHTDLLVSKLGRA